MRLSLQKLREYRQKLEQLCPQKGLRKWSVILSEFRVAGVPRAVSASQLVVIFSDMIADPNVPAEIKPALQESLTGYMESTAYRERAWLDEEDLELYLAAYRVNDYESPWHEPWNENRAQNPVSS